MIKHKIAWVFKIIAFVIVAGVAMGFVMMFLWNWLVPDLFGGPVITFWQALGLLALTKLVLPSFGGKNHWKQKKEHYWKKRYHEKLSKMTPEEQEKFKAGFKKRCRNWCDSDFEDADNQNSAAAQAEGS